MFLTRLKHWFIQKVLGRKPLCRCCALVGEPIYSSSTPGGQAPVCEICDDYKPGGHTGHW